MAAFRDLRADTRMLCEVDRGDALAGLGLAIAGLPEAGRESALSDLRADARGFDGTGHRATLLGKLGAVIASLPEAAREAAFYDLRADARGFSDAQHCATVLGGLGVATGSLSGRPLPAAVADAAPRIAIPRAPAQLTR
jgi:hypothetical protein